MEKAESNILKDYIGREIFDWRKNQKLKQSDVAKLIGVSQPVYSRLESGKAKISLEQLLDIANALKVTNGELIRSVGLFRVFFSMT